jgi:hypothetical protein
MTVENVDGGMALRAFAHQPVICFCYSHPLSCYSPSASQARMVKPGRDGSGFERRNGPKADDPRTGHKPS